MGNLAPAPAAVAVAEAFRSDWGRVVGYLIRVTGNWDLAEECAQDAFAKALERWPLDGIPTSPLGWLKTTARNRALDRLRRTTVGEAKLKELAMTRRSGHDDEGDESGIEDDRLRLMFTCCHPALPLEAQVALTLRTLAGLTTYEIARAFLVPPETMAKRLVRAKHKIQDAGIPYRVPPARRLAEAVAPGGHLLVVGHAPSEAFTHLTASHRRAMFLADELLPAADEHRRRPAPELAVRAKRGACRPT